MTPKPGQGQSAPLSQQHCLSCDYGEPVLIKRPDRDLCLRMGNALARDTRVFEAMGAYRAAELHRALELVELEHLALGLVCFIREFEWDLPTRWPNQDPEVTTQGKPPTCTMTWEAASLRELLSCPRCRALLHKPVSLLFGLTVCESCLDPGANAQTPALRVNVVLSKLLARCFPALDRVRALAGEARTLLSQQQPELALLRCQEALELVPKENSLMLLRAELHLNMKNYEKSFQDASVVCYKDPFFIQGHHVKAQALSGLGRTKEMLKELLYCLALNPEYDTVKADVQKVIHEVFFPDSRSVSQNLTSPVVSDTGSMLQSHEHTNTQSSEECSNPGISEVWSVCSCECNLE
ncbi:PREDICTED: LON peptidase N-terminal domain and RING finger protein 2 [Elephantulus edwardii]|uniref:LON peptidase N-terminal domain and RING finger protein 2 n=1 Tax=Elephantulus edwardii TaxID=28737 RepID=UPI0003F0936A|nr:PREDICTED: LON peptidase N-terminal domain and RING finger protein 2 [Elephantulus edwardii]